MEKENFPYVGYVYGGFNEVHEESLKYDYELLLHNGDKCFLCQEKKKKLTQRRKSKREKKMEKEKDETIKTEISGSLWDHKTKIKYSKINEIYSGKNIKTHFCVLCKYKNKDYENDKIKVLIILLIDENMFELYKFEKIKEYKDIEEGNDIKEKKRKKSEYYDLGKEKSEENDNDTYLTLLEKFSVCDIITLNKDNNFKNIVNISVKDIPKEKYKEKDKEKDKKLLKRLSVNFFQITLDFSSPSDSNKFTKDFQNIINNFKSKKNKNK